MEKREKLVRERQEGQGGGRKSREEIGGGEEKWKEEGKRKET
jgi:hypothetical protein